jgi:hypothetical protein
MKNPQSTQEQIDLVEIFTGSGNGQADALESAMTRYHSWRLAERKEGRPVHEISLEHTFRQHNPVHCRCILKVRYTLL